MTLTAVDSGVRRQRLARVMVGLVLCAMLTTAACGGASNERAHAAYSREAWDYFGEVAFHRHFPGVLMPLRRWDAEAPPVVMMRGEPTPRDVRTLRQVIAELRELTGLDIRFTTDPRESTLDVYLSVTHAGLHRAFPNTQNRIVNGAVGLFVVDASKDGIIVRATAGVAGSRPDGTPYGDRTLLDHVIREEVTQAIGLLNDSPRYRGSIFQQDPYDRPTEYLEIDREIIRLLYDPNVKAGMPPHAVEAAIAIADGQQR
jgi:hypothetical protein